MSEYGKIEQDIPKIGMNTDEKARKRNRAIFLAGRWTTIIVVLAFLVQVIWLVMKGISYLTQMNSILLGYSQAGWLLIVSPALFGMVVFFVGFMAVFIAGQLFKNK